VQHTASDACKWSALEVSEFFKANNFTSLDAMKFYEHQIDGEALMVLERSDLRMLRLKVGVLAKMWQLIEKLKQKN
jgi:Sterile alpha motif (SAM)/Pointed domain